MQQHNGVAPQGYQYRIRGLNATPTGSTDTSVARFSATAGTEQEIGNISSASWLELGATPDVNGSRFKISRRGVYRVDARINLLASADLVLALTLDTTELAVIPTIAADATRDFAIVTAAAATLTSVHLGADMLISQAMAGEATEGIVRLLITDEAGAAPPAGEIDLGSVQLLFTRVSDLRMES